MLPLTTVSFTRLAVVVAVVVVVVVVAAAAAAVVVVVVVIVALSLAHSLQEKTRHVLTVLIIPGASDPQHFSRPAVPRHVTTVNVSPDS